MQNKGARFLVTGVVQGVFYRANTQRKATELGVTGWVRNLPDGRVEVLAFGTEQQLIALRAWLWQGPERARVDAVECLDTEYQDDCTDFTVC